MVFGFWMPVKFTSGIYSLQASMRISSLVKINIPDNGSPKGHHLNRGRYLPNCLELGIRGLFISTARRTQRGKTVIES